MPLAARLTNTFVAPGALGESLAQHPRWGSAMVLVVLIALTTAVILYMTPAGKKLMLETMKQQMRGQNLPGGEAQMEKSFVLVQGSSVIGTMLCTPVFIFIMGGVLWVVCSLMLGAQMGYASQLGVATHGYIIMSIGYLLSMSLSLTRGVLRSTLSLAAFVPHAPIDSPVYIALALFDFFALWSIVAMGVMVARGGRLSVWKPVVVLLGIYFVVAGGLAAFGSAMSSLAKH